MINNTIMTVVQCWDDGVTTDARLTDILRRRKAKATFNLNAGLHGNDRKLSWIYENREVWRLGWNEMRAVYKGFVIANHSLTHPRLDQISIEAARHEIIEGRCRLQQFFGQPVHGFAYPFGAYSDAVMRLVHEAGHLYARTVDSTECSFPPLNAMAFNPCCHFLSADFWPRYEKAKQSGIFYFWGHSYEMISERMWDDFEALIARISSDPDACWADVSDLFTQPVL